MSAEETLKINLQFILMAPIGTTTTRITAACIVASIQMEFQPSLLNTLQLCIAEDHLLYQMKSAGKIKINWVISWYENIHLKAVGCFKKALTLFLLFLKIKAFKYNINI